MYTRPLLLVRIVCSSSGTSVVKVVAHLFCRQSQTESQMKSQMKARYFHGNKLDSGLLFFFLRGLHKLFL